MAGVGRAEGSGAVLVTATVPVVDSDITLWFWEAVPQLLQMVKTGSIVLLSPSTVVAWPCRSKLILIG
jgi:hypothetical protein